LGQVVLQLHWPQVEQPGPGGVHQAPPTNSRPHLSVSSSSTQHEIN